jgi:hypothetical protein
VQGARGGGGHGGAPSSSPRPRRTRSSAGCQGDEVSTPWPRSSAGCQRDEVSTPPSLPLINQLGLSMAPIVGIDHSLFVALRMRILFSSWPSGILYL